MPGEEGVDLPGAVGVSVVITTDLDFAEWSTVFKDVKITTALFDRHCHIARQATGAIGSCAAARRRRSASRPGQTRKTGTKGDPTDVTLTPTAHGKALWASVPRATVPQT